MSNPSYLCSTFSPRPGVTSERRSLISLIEPWAQWGSEGAYPHLNDHLTSLALTSGSVGRTVAGLRVQLARQSSGNLTVVLTTSKRDGYLDEESGKNTEGKVFQDLWTVLPCAEQRIVPDAREEDCSPQPVHQKEENQLERLRRFFTSHKNRSELKIIWQWRNLQLGGEVNERY